MAKKKAAGPQIAMGATPKRGRPAKAQADVAAKSTATTTTRKPRDTNVSAAAGSKRTTNSGAAGGGKTRKSPRGT
jgi:hypothetical protein